MPVDRPRRRAHRSAAVSLGTAQCPHQALRLRATHSTSLAFPYVRGKPSAAAAACLCSPCAPVTGQCQQPGALSLSALPRSVLGLLSTGQQRAPPWGLSQRSLGLLLLNFSGPRVGAKNGNSTRHMSRCLKVVHQAITLLTRACALRPHCQAHRLVHPHSNPGGRSHLALVDSWSTESITGQVPTPPQHNVD